MTDSNLNVPSAKASSRTELQQIFSFLHTIGLLIIAVIAFRTWIIEPFKIPSGSMRPTLVEGDYILVSKFRYGLGLPFYDKVLVEYASPRRGDIVVFTRPDDPSTSDTDESSINIIKRVIGLPGDTIEVKGTMVYINNKEYPESYVRWERGGKRDGEFGPAKVPEGHVFMMGDNRDNSNDSRFWEDGHFLDIKRIKGQAFIIYWSWDSLTRITKIIR